MKIAILINTFHMGKGMDSIAYLQALELEKNGHKVSIFTFDSSIESEKLDINEIGWPTPDIINYIYRIIYPLNVYKIDKLSNILKSYDIMIAHFYPMTYLAYVTKKQKEDLKYIYYNHGLIDNKKNPLLKRFYEKVLFFLMQKSISNADYVISVSKCIDKTLQHPTAKKEIIYNTINPNCFAYSMDEIDNKIITVKEKIGEEKNSAPVYLYVGVISINKGIPMLIESFKKVRQQYPNAKLILAGQQSYEFNINKYITNEISSDVYYFGHVSYANLAFLYELCDVYVSASTFESFNLPAVEAQLFGKPVVVFDVGAHNEVISNHNTGQLVEPYDINKFAEAMIKVYIDKDLMMLNAKEWASSFLSTKERKNTITNFIDCV